MRELVVVVLMVAMASCKDEKAARKQDAAAAAPSPASEKPTPPPAVEAPTHKAGASNPDLDKLCAQAKEILATPAKEHSARWSKAVRSLPDGPVKKGFSAIGGMKGSDFMELAKQIAKEAGAASWTCPDLETLSASL